MRDINEHDNSHDSEAPQDSRASHDSEASRASRDASASPAQDSGLRAPGLRDPEQPGPEPHRAEVHGPREAEVHGPHGAEVHGPSGVEGRGPRHCGPETPEPAFHDPAAHGSSAEPRITLRGPAELADALPYLLGFHPTDSIVLVALHGESGRFGGRVRVGLPASPQEWPDLADQLADCLVTGSERRGPRPDGIVVFLCQDPAADGTGRQVMQRLRPLAQRLRIACGSLDVPVREALCISDGRYWSYCCPDTRCCPAEGNVLALPGTSVMAAAATYAGIQVRGSLREMEERLTPWRSPAAVAEQERALDAAAAAMFPRILGDGDRRTVADETLDLASRLIRRIADAPMPPRGTDAARAVGRSSGALLLGGNAADELDDGLIAHDEAAAVILGLQDRTTRDWAAEWMEEPDAGPALRLWRALARRCVGPYGDHAAALLTLAGWVSWSTGDEPHARVAFGLALRADPDYRFAYLLHQACNQGLDPEELRVCLREERAARLAGPGAPAASGASGVPGGGHSRDAAPVAEVLSAPPEAAPSSKATAESSPEATVEPASEAAAPSAGSGARPRSRPKPRRDVTEASRHHGSNGQRQKGSSGRPVGASRPDTSRPDASRPDASRPDVAGPRPEKARVRVRRRGGEPVAEEGTG
ncbi:hypothetical protein CG740_16360 [Streptomyces sp. CB01201]|uniref:DUF4192 domain-containing protein n=1 Tax=Streptomyces sp. CB01201 TaxID=2020324 RepID=UPI000C277717|nr:hypothetical protein CG740_16360 [Streptomyces sp. CB01201]